MQEITILGTIRASAHTNDDFDVAAVRKDGKLILRREGSPANVRPVVAFGTGERGPGDD